jgi:hypothetical protein
MRKKQGSHVRNQKLRADCFARYGLPGEVTGCRVSLSEHGPNRAVSYGPRTAEIALARSAAPESISGDAEVQVLGRHGFETAVKGENGFVCEKSISKHVIINLPVADLSKSMASSRHSTFSHGTQSKNDSGARIVVGDTISLLPRSEI